jgi:hypothetical protein
MYRHFGMTISGSKSRRVPLAKRLTFGRYIFGDACWVIDSSE